MAEDNKKSPVNIDHKIVDGMQVKVYTPKEGHDTVYKVLSEGEICKAEEEYRKKLQEEADRKFQAKNQEMEKNFMYDLTAKDFDAQSIPMEGAAESIAIDTENIAEYISHITKDDRIVCIGDSITYGYQVDGPMTWIGRLRREEEINLLNLGINGDTTGNMLARFHEHVIDLEPKAVHIMGGCNDILAQTPVEYIVNNIVMMVQMALDRGIVPIIGLTPEPTEKSMPEGVKQMIDFSTIKKNMEIYRDWLLKFVDANKLPYINFEKEMKNRLRAGYSRYFLDALHPNPAGHKIMTAIAKDAFVGMGILPRDEEKPDNRFSL